MAECHSALCCRRTAREAVEKNVAGGVLMPWSPSFNSCTYVPFIAQLLPCPPPNVLFIVSTRGSCALHGLQMTIKRRFPKVSEPHGNNIYASLVGYTNSYASYPRKMFLPSVLSKKTPTFSHCINFAEISERDERRAEKGVPGLPAGSPKRRQAARVQSQLSLATAVLLLLDRSVHRLLPRHPLREHVGKLVSAGPRCC